MIEHHDIFDEIANPLDHAEEIFNAHDWFFTRTSEDELSVQIQGKNTSYLMTFLWQENYSAINFHCACDVALHQNNLDQAAIIMTHMNKNLWMGHFEIEEGTNFPVFRHTSLLRGMVGGSGVELVEDLIDIALSECERFASVFSLLSRKDIPSKDTLSLAMHPPVGNA